MGHPSLSGFGGVLRGEVLDLAQIIGFVAGFGTTFAALPDLIELLQPPMSASRGKEDIR
jgi:hypothetical protein